MRGFDVAIGVGWLFFWCYWLVRASHAKRNVSSRLKQFVGLRIVILGLLIFMAVAVKRSSQKLNDHWLGTSDLVLIIGLGLFLIGMSLAIWARVYLGANWGMPMSLKKDPDLITTGPYKYIRHPIYAGLILMLLGSSIDINFYWLIAMVIAGAYFIYSAFAEEKVLSKQFPKTYPSYKSSSKMLIPFIF